MSELFALAAATSYGSADFLGALATKRRHILHVLGVGHLVGLLVISAIAAIGGGSPSGADLIWGAAAGAVGLLGLGSLYWSLATGYMGVVAPMTAAIGAAIPVVAGFLLGERPARLAVAGVGVAVVAIVLISSGGAAGWSEKPQQALQVFAGSAVAGIGLGMFFVFLQRVEASAGMWPLVSARLTSVAIVLVVLAVVRPVFAGRSTTQSAVAGALDMSANAFVLAAYDGGLLIVVSALASLYPAVTALLARLFLKERLGAGQVVGLAFAMVAVALISMA